MECSTSALREATSSYWTSASFNLRTTSSTGTLPPPCEPHTYTTPTHLTPHTHTHTLTHLIDLLNTFTLSISISISLSSIQPTAKNHLGCVRCLSLCPANRHLLLIGYEKGVLSLWDLEKDVATRNFPGSVQECQQVEVRLYSAVS